MRGREMALATAAPRMAMPSSAGGWEPCERVKAYQPERRPSSILIDGTNE
jgi:hypothetical protein